MAAVSLHPLASRSGAQSSTIVSIDIKEQGQQPITSSLSSSAPGELALGHPGAAAAAATGGSCCSHDDHEIGSADPSHDEHWDLLASSPTTRALSPGNPFTDDNGMDTHCDPRPEWGIHHADLEQYAAIDDYDDATGSPPLRIMNAAQFAELQERYAALDVPHNVVFPFLHGVDGDNAAQCAFFRAPPTGQPTPNYRGLTVVRADMPAPHQRFSHKRGSSSISTSAHDALHRGRANSLATTASSLNSIGDSDEDEDEGATTYGTSISHDSTGRRMRTMTESKSTTSASSSNVSRASSLFSQSMTPAGDAYTSDLNREDGNALRASEAAAYTARANRQRTLRSEPQPLHSMLASTILPDELIHPPILQTKNGSSLQVATQGMRIEDFGHDAAIVRDACFVRPRQADGISLRNFKTQNAKYATISDIVIYCPVGMHEGVVTFAHWVRAAQDQLYEERVSRGLGSLRYNVFIISDPFETFEQSFSHLVAIDGSGFSRNRIDFVERERDEMQRFTEASEIDDNVFMGCTANVPVSVEDLDGHGHGTSGGDSSLSLDSYLPQDVNPHGFSICVEAMEMAELPDLTCLDNAAQVLSTLEAGAEIDVIDQDAAQTDASCDDCALADGRLSLGPGGWSPRPKTRSASSGSGQCPHFLRSKSTSSLPATASSSPIYYPPPSNIIHLKALGSGNYLESEGAMQEAVDRIVNFCAWIYKQSHAPVAASTSPAVGNNRSLHGNSTGPFSPSLFHNAWRRGANQPKISQQFPRRVLLHCGDGYTDSSIMGLAYLMYARRLSLPEAYLDLQNRCNRCFFVYARDVPFLQRIERRIGDEMARMRYLRSDDLHSRSTSPRLSARRTASRRNEQENEGAVPASSSEQSVWARSLAAATGLVTGSQNQTRKTATASESTSVRTGTPTPRRTTPTPTRSPVIRPTPVASPDSSWFTNPNFQGSFPSRILPFLYLGNLNHALNPGMLHALGITHVVSVGESALVPPSTEDNLFEAAAAVHAASNGSQANFGSGTHRSGRSGAPQHATLWEEERCGRISVLDLKNVSDDGIDSLRPHMKRAVEYIEQARLQGGKALVHCRVGVSRSATICIAYVMAHCDLSMIESFLLVRSRRMNVLTQPTLLFVWELRGFETHLAHLKAQRAQRAKQAHLPLQHRLVQKMDLDSSGDRFTPDASIDDSFSLAALSISSNEQSHDQGAYRRMSGAKTAGTRLQSTPSYIKSTREHAKAGNGLDVAEATGSLDDYLGSEGLDMRQSIFYHEDLGVDIGAGAGSVYGKEIANARQLPFNSGSLTHLDYLSAKLTHGYFCKALSELNARYMVN